MKLLLKAIRYYYLPAYLQRYKYFGNYKDFAGKCIGIMAMANHSHMNCMEIVVHFEEVESHVGSEFLSSDAHVIFYLTS